MGGFFIMIIPRKLAVRDLLQGKRYLFGFSQYMGETIVVVTSSNGRVDAYLSTPMDYANGILIWNGKQTSIGVVK
jgi:hypothetical protein